MADVSAAIEYVLGQEDGKLSGVITTNSDGVTKTRYGIDQRYHPELTACGFYNDMGSIAAMQIAKGIYDISYSQPLCIAEIANQDVATKVLSLGLNLGVQEASKMLQDVLLVNGDGRIGPLTLHALDLAEPVDVLAGLRAEAERYYIEDVKEHPEKEEYLNGWLRRARA